MTNWARVDKLRASGKDWATIASDPKVDFRSPRGTNPGRALKVLYLKNRSTARRTATTFTAERRPKVPGRGTRGQWIALGAVLVIMILVVAYALQVQSSHASPTGWVGRPAPDFSLSIANGGGGTFHLSQERNVTNVLLFFNEGLSCAPCLTQMQQLDADASQFQAAHVLIVSITGDTLSQMTTWASNAYVDSSIVLADPTLGVCNAYDTTGAAVSMMPGTAPGHTFLLVDKKGVVLWRADYGPDDMSVPDSEILSAVQSSLGI